MDKKALQEADDILQRALTNLLAQDPPPLVDPDSSNLRRAVGALRTNSREEINAGAVAADIFECWELARAAGATTFGMEVVRVWVRAETPVYLPGQLMAAALMRFCLIEQAYILSGTVFSSRDDIDAAIDSYSAAIDDAILYASEQADQDVYISLVGLASAVVSDLNYRAQPLPRIVTYEFPQSMPALWLAQRLYGDASRAEELVAQVKAVHPAFMPRTGKCLSA